MKNSIFLVIAFFRKKIEFLTLLIIYWYGQLSTFSLIFDVLSEFGVEIDQKVRFRAFLK
jgi:hypothetical protein